MKTQKWYHKKILCIPIWAIGFAVLITAAGYAQQQTLQLATYYPAPYGEYTQMKVAEKLEMLPTSKLQATKGAGVSRTGLQVDLTKQDPEAIQLSSFSDINNTNYMVDPSSLTTISQVRITGNSGNGQAGIIDFGGMQFSNWPVVAFPAGAYTTTTPPIPASSRSTKLYYGTAQTSGTKINVKLPGPAFKNPMYFVMISPRQLYSPGSYGSHGHRMPSPYPDPRDNSVSLNFNYYKFTVIKATSNFIVTFEGSTPVEFDWIAIGY